MDVITTAINTFISEGAKISYSSYYGYIVWQRLISVIDYVGQTMTLLERRFRIWLHSHAPGERVGM